MSLLIITIHLLNIARSTQWQHPGIQDEANQIEDIEARRRRVHISQDDTISLRDRQSIVSENDSTIDQLHNLSIQGETSQPPAMEERRGAMDHVDAGGRQHPPTSASNTDSSATGATGGPR